MTFYASHLAGELQSS